MQYIYIFVNLCLFNQTNFILGILITKKNAFCLFDQNNFILDILITNFFCWYELFNTKDKPSYICQLIKADLNVNPF